MRCRAVRDEPLWRLLNGFLERGAQAKRQRGREIEAQRTDGDGATFQDLHVTVIRRFERGERAKAMLVTAFGSGDEERSVA